jgi:hypothetical protein
MKHRSIAGLILAVALALAACAPQDTGGESSAEPSAHDASHAPTESKAPSETDGGGRYDY